MTLKTKVLSLIATLCTLPAGLLHATRWTSARSGLRCGPCGYVHNLVSVLRFR